MNAFHELRQAYGEIADIDAALSALQWDQATYMPKGGAAWRGNVMSTLSALRHERFLHPKFDDLLAQLKSNGSTTEERQFIDELAWNRDRALKMPESLVRDIAKCGADSFNAWVEAKTTSNFKLFAPHLEKMVELSRKSADCLGYEEHPLDALLQWHERELRVSTVRPLLGDLCAGTVPLLERIVAKGPSHSPEFLNGKWDDGKQWDFTIQVLRDFGYSFENGRQDRSEHPFSCEISPGDVRVTTRINENDLFLAMSGSFHEAGHALYQQGMPIEDARTPLRDSPGTGIHESQSRMWEIHIGSSLAFWEHYLPILRTYFPGRLDNVGVDEFHAAVNRVTPSFIRTEADEVTYNLHIALRFELEVALLEGSLKAADLPDAWNAKMKELLGIVPTSDRVGCLQDVHWSEGMFGYFPSYSLGNIYSAMLMDQIEKDIPDLWDRVREGNFTTLLAWLREHVHRHGRRIPTGELLRRATGKGPTVKPILARQEKKYTALYGLS